MARAAAPLMVLAVTAMAMTWRALLMSEGTTVPASEPAAPLLTLSPSSSPVEEATAPRSEALRSTRSPGERSSASRSSAHATHIPESGTGDFDVAPGSSGQVGHGDLVTYSVEVEGGLPFAARAVAREVDRVLADQRGWTSVLSRTLERVAAKPALRIRMATPETADALCAPLDTGGRLSCRNGEMVVLNAWRWANGAKAYGEDLRNYRIYMINHEIGHALGKSHAACPAAGSPAPVMVQQTKGLEGCTPNAWPSAGDQLL